MSCRSIAAWDAFLVLSSRRRGDQAAPPFDEVEPAGTDDDYSTSFTEVSEALDDLRTRGLAERAGGAPLQHFPGSMRSLVAVAAGLALFSVGRS